MHYIVAALLLSAIPHVFAQDATLANTTSASAVSVAASSSVPVDSLETSAPGIISPNYVLKGFDGCDDDKKKAIKNAFSEMVELLMRDQVGQYPGPDWNSAAAQDFFGSFEFNSGVRDHIKANLDRAAAVTYQWWLNPFATRLHARCDDPLDECYCRGPGFTDAYTVNHQPEINFCWHFFEQPTLSAALKAPERGAWEYIMAFMNQATVFVHELMHISQIGYPIGILQPGIVDQIVVGWPGLYNQKAYGDRRTKWLAQNPGGIASDMVDNADNYAMFFLASYVQDKLGYYPHRRVLKLFPSGPDGLSNLNVTAGDISEEVALGSYCYTGSY